MPSGLVDVVERDVYVFCSNPSGIGHPLAGECLDIFNGVVGRIDKERSDEIEADVVGDVGSWFFVEVLAANVLDVI